MFVETVEGSEVPINEYIIKVSSRCNLNCSYCYEYNKGDNTWRNMQRYINDQTVVSIANRICEHAVKHQLQTIFISLHGGEPLLMGAKKLRQILKILHSTLSSADFEFHFSLQTNGTLISEKIIKIFQEFRVNVGISIDGNKIHNDRFRLSHKGASTFEATVQGMMLLQNEAPNCFGGCLAVVDLQNPAIEVADSLYSMGVRNVDFLLPHHNWDDLPFRLRQDGTDYADWYLDIWWSWLNGRWPQLKVRFLENLVSRIVGLPGIYEQMSLSPANLITINTNGEIEGVDTLKSVGNQNQITNLNVFEHSFDEVLKLHSYQSRCKPKEELCTKCRECDVNNICVGGYLPHRYSAERKFENPSVYCADLIYLIKTVEGSIMENVSK